VFLLIALPFVFGYLLVARVLRETCTQLRLSLAYALGLLAFLTGVNAFFHFYTLRHSVYLTLAVLAVSSIGLLKLRPLTSFRLTVSRSESLVLWALALTAFFDALFWQMRSSDDDVFIHAPLMAAYLRDIFPPRNPIFPDLRLFGHYGRDLTIAALSSLVGERFFEVQYAVTALNHAVLIPLAYFVGRRYFRSSNQALLAVLFAFLGVNNAARGGLLETFQNNNTFANLFLFVGIYLALAVVTRRQVLHVVVGGLALGTYSVIYETHFGVLLIVLGAFPLVLGVCRSRWRLRHLVRTWSMLLIAGLVSIVQGGTVTDVFWRHVSGTRMEVSQSEDERRMTQEIRIGFPKSEFRITSPQGEEYPFWSLRLVRESGIFVTILPLTIALMIVWRKLLGVLVGMIATASLLVPATVDFGAFNSESLRFLMLGGVAAAMLAGVSMAAVWSGCCRRWPAGRPVVTACLACILLASFWPSLHTAFTLFSSVARSPADYFLVPEDWACSQPLVRPCAPLDVAAAVALRGIANPGERTLVYNESDDRHAVLVVQSLMAAFSRTFVVGAGIRVAPAGLFSMAQPYFEPTGFRARAFWQTLDVGLLDDMQVTYLLLDPEALPPDVYRQLVMEPRLDRIVRREDGDGLAAREVYRVKPLSKTAQVVDGESVHLLGVEWPSMITAGHVYRLPVVLAAAPTVSGGELGITYRVNFAGGPQVNAGDEVRQRVGLEPAGPLTWRGAVWFAAPYEPGDYEVHFLRWRDDLPHPRRLAYEGKPLRISVR
jgi:hypothetical protein